MAGEFDGADRPHQDTQPIFILGILPRCGTNFLMDLLCSHPDCAPPAPIWEDFLVTHADLLARYVDRVSQRWNRRWGEIDSLRDQLMTHLGVGLTSFLDERSGAGRTATKTPRVENLEWFFKLFPKAPLVILVRDGRSVVESGIRTFGWNREWATHKWVEAADRILEFDRKHRKTDARYRIVRYEDLCENLEKELRGILDFVGLDADLYDFEAASQLPVRGSSTIREDGSEVHWKPVAKPKNFDPVSRYSHWTRAKHERFNWIAGQSLERLGYTPQRVPSASALWAAWNLILGVRWQAIRLLGPIYLKLKARIARRPAPSTALRDTADEAS